MDGGWSLLKEKLLSHKTLIILGLLVYSVIEAECAGFCYDDPSCGPATWGQFSPVCDTGSMQSPINLESVKANRLQKSVNLVLSKEYSYVNSPFLLKNNGHSVSLSLNIDDVSQGLVKGNGFLPNGPYFFSSLHFHWGPDDFTGSEHTIDSRAFPLELHMIHKQSSNWNQLAVFGILYQISDYDNPVLNPIIENLPIVQIYGNSTLISPAYAVNLTAFIPKKVKAYRYRGSLTTPTCDEGVIWTVFDDIQSVSKRQMMAFRSLFNQNGNPLTTNYRPVQPAYTSQRKTIYYLKSIASKAG